MKATLYGTLFCCCLSTTIFGQSFRASLVGQITDANKDAIPGAIITLEDKSNGQRLTAVADEDGHYSMQQIQPGTYEMRVEAKGFGSSVTPEVVLEIGQARRLHIALQTGDVNDTVTVTAEAVTLNTEVGSKTEVMTTRQIEDLPLNGRNYLDLAKLLPGVVESAESTGNLNTNGTRSDATGYIQDGLSNRIDRGAGQAVVTSPDTIQEFRVETSTYSAQYGRTAGAQITVISKTGTNKISGSLFEFARNDFFDARDPFLLPTDDKKLNRHQFGGTVGGPLPLPRFGSGGPSFTNPKNHSFFFFSYDGFRERRSVNASTTAPHPDWLKGDFRNLRTAGPDGRLGTTDDLGRVLYPTVTTNANGTISIARREFPTQNVIPDNLKSPAALKLLPYIPAANVPGTLIGYVASGINNVNNRIMSVRVDQRFGEKTSFFVRYAWTNNANFNPSLGQSRDFYPNFGGTTEARNRLLTSGFTKVISPGVINEFRLGANQTRQFIYGQYLGRDMNREFGITNVPVDPQVAGFPLIRVDGFPNFGDRDAWPNRFRAGNFQISDTLTWVKRGHSFKFGGEVFWTHYDENNYNSPRGNFRFRGRASNPSNAVSSGPLSFADFMMGYLHTVELGDVPKASEFRNTQFSLYVQDDWNVTPRFTLNLGLRYDVLGPLTERNNRISNYVPQVNKLICATAEKAPCVVDPDFPPALIRNNLNDFGPRFGFAWRPFNKTVIRGGVGMFYSLTLLTLTRQQFATGFPFTNTLNYSVTTGTYNPDSLRLDRTLTAGTTITGLNNPRGTAVNDPTGSVYQYNLTIERELTKDLAMEISYVGSQGRHLGRRYNINPLLINKALFDPNRLNTQLDYVIPQIRRLAQAGINTTFGDIIYQENSGTSSYNSGQISFRRRARRGLIMQGAYAFSSSFDTASFVDAGALGSAFQYPQDPDRLNLEHGLSDFDRRHRFTGSFVYDLPFGRGQKFLTRKGFAQAVFGGFQLNGTTILQTGRPFTPKLQTADFTGQRPDLIGDPRKDIPAGRYFNPFAFGDPSRTTSIDAKDPNLYGTAGRGLLRGPNYQSVNLSLIRNFRLRETVRAQFRFEAFNVLNRPNFDLPDFTLETPIFNDALPKDERLRQAPASAALSRIVIPMRELQLGLRITF
ncbi:MAG TPA: TonB-dependent receptor [Blastocatellia bacterium]|nr:TonB-dependent receptor [Blastocatellia bacterium]